MSEFDPDVKARFQRSIPLPVVTKSGKGVTARDEAFWAAGYSEGLKSALETLRREDPVADPLRGITTPATTPTRGDETDEHND